MCDQIGKEICIYIPETRDTCAHEACFARSMRYIEGVTTVTVSSVKLRTLLGTITSCSVIASRLEMGIMTAVQPRASIKTLISVQRLDRRVYTRPSTAINSEARTRARNRDSRTVPILEEEPP